MSDSKDPEDTVLTCQKDFSYRLVSSFSPFKGHLRKVELVLNIDKLIVKDYDTIKIHIKETQ